MKNEDLIEVLDALLEQMNTYDLLGNAKNRLAGTVSELRAAFQSVTVEKRYAEVYRSLIGKGKKLLTLYKVDADPKEVQGKTRYYVGYLNAAYGDFTGQVRRIQPFYRLFLLCSILFLALSPMLLGPLFSLIFLIPIALAMKGIKQRSRNGYLLGMLIVPASLMTSVLWIRIGIQTLTGFNGMLEMTMKSSGLARTPASILTVGAPLGGVVLFILAAVFLWKGYQVRKLFV